MYCILYYVSYSFINASFCLLRNVSIRILNKYAWKTQTKQKSVVYNLV